jgi:tetratricopeptide (TPR) repeat protein
MSGTTLPALVAAVLLADDPMQKDLAAARLAQREAIHVRRVSESDQPLELDIDVYGAPVHEVLARVASLDGRDFKLEAGEAALSASAAVDVRLVKRPFADAIEWIAGAAGLLADTSRGVLRLKADSSTSFDPAVALRKAVDGWRAALAADPLQVDAPRLRFQIGNALYQLGDFRGAIEEWARLEESAGAWRQPARDPDGRKPGPDFATEFADLALVLYRSGHAHAALGEESQAQARWLTLADRFATSPLVADARINTARSCLRLGDRSGAALSVRMLLETQHDLTVPNLVEAGEVLEAIGSSERACETLTLALRTVVDPAFEERALLALATAQSTLRAWTLVVETADRYVRRVRNGRHAAEVWLMLAKALEGLDDPFSAMLAARRCRELRPFEDVALSAELVEGRIWAECGVSGRAENCLERAGGSTDPVVAGEALDRLIRLLLETGSLETASRHCQRMRKLPGQATAASVLLARICLAQRNRDRCLEVIREALPTADEPGRAALEAIARDAMRELAPDAAIRELERDSTRPADGGTPEKERDHGR